MSEVYHDAQLPQVKRCSQCGVKKPLDAFYKSPKKKLGCECACKECMAYRRKHPCIVQKPLFVVSKICKKCGIEKPLDQFYTKTTKDGKSWPAGQCKACTIADMQRKYREIHPLIEKPLPVHGGKICNTCHIEKPLDAFGHEKRRKDGYSWCCKKCTQASVQTRRAKTRRRPLIPPPTNGGKVCSKCHAEKPLDAFPKGKTRSGLLAKCKECINRESRDRYAKADKEPIAKKNRHWYENNSDRHRELRQKWARENPLKTIQIYRRYVAKKRANTIDDVDYGHILERDGYYCHICESEILPQHKIHFDHVIPISKGGPHSEDNVKVAHATCNIRKSDRLLEEMTPYQRRGV